MAKELVFLFEKSEISADKLTNSMTLKEGQILHFNDIPNVINDNDLKSDLAEVFSYGDSSLKAEIFAGFLDNDFSCIRIFSSISSNYKWSIRMLPRLLDSKDFKVLYTNKTKRKFVKLKEDIMKTDLTPFFKVIDT